MRDRVYVLITVLLLGLAACGDDDNGNDDTLLTGLSGVIIAALVIWLVVRTMRKRK